MCILMVSAEEMAPRRDRQVSPGTRTTKGHFMATEESSAPHAHPSTEDHDHEDSEAIPHTCNDGWVTLGQIVVDPETGEEVEEFALYLCRRCADNR
jgi:hypothetical protein